MKLPEKEYYSISDIAERWSRQTGVRLKWWDIIDYIRQGKLKPKIYSHDEYGDISEDTLSIFDLTNIDTSLVKNFGELSFRDLNNQTVKDFVNHCEINMTEKLKNIYVHISDLLNCENNSSTSSSKLEKPLHTKERESVSIIILALAKHAKIDITQGSKAAGIIIGDATSDLELDISKNTVTKFLKDALETLPQDKYNLFKFN